MPYSPYSSRPVPISTANIHGPRRSPITLEIPRLFSANSDAHWLIASSLAPAQVISNSAIQSSLEDSSSRTDMPLSSAGGGTSGTVKKLIALSIGTTDQQSGSHVQCAEPISRSASVEISTTATCPQQ